VLKGAQACCRVLVVALLGAGLCDSSLSAFELEPNAIAPEALAVHPQVLSGIAALIVTGLLFLLYFYRRRLYILYWILGWLITAVATFLTAYHYPHPKLGWFAYGMSQLLAILGALVFVISADAYRTRPRLRRGYALALLPIVLWFGLAPVALGPMAAFAPGHLLLAGALGAAGLAHLALMRRTRMLGAAVVGTMMLATGASNAWLALGAHQPDSLAATPIALLCLVLNLVMALGMQLMTFEDMTYELRSANRRLESAQWELRQMVTTDGLTGCRNRRFFDQVISREVERHRRYGIPLSMVFVDIDRFKAVNDTLGHEGGDRVLQEVAAFLVRNVREADYVFRWGGDEFLILISCTEAEAVRKARELQEAFAETEARALPPGVGLSIGCAEVPSTSSDIMALVRVADERMYLNKRELRA
jgi:diguanylate cyclase (GGDEF)-like protein